MNFERLKNFMDSLTNWIMPGNSIVVYKDNKLVFEYSSGFSNVTDGIKMKSGDLINIYSCTKPITIVAAMQLYERGKFLLSNPLYDFIPEYRTMYVKKEEVIEKAKSPITMQNLFTMTAGFSYNSNTNAFQKAKRITDGKMNTVEVIKCLAEDPLLFHPGDHWKYSLCHDVLAAVVEVISGIKFRDYVCKNIFEPLGMNDVYFHNENVRDRMAEQYIYRKENENIDVVEAQMRGYSKNGKLENIGKAVTMDLGIEYDSGGAGMTTSVKEYGKFAAALANGGIGLNGERIISKASIDLIKTNQLNDTQLKDFNWSQLAGYGYGLGVRTMMDKARGGSNSSIGEFGWGGAAGATLLVDTDLKLGVFYAHHMLNQQESYYQPRLRNVLYSCI